MVTDTNRRKDKILEQILLLYFTKN
uniref:Tubulin-specific chaperone c n=1 Tax=Triatoma infestans TaxID=30076 RepID=A0A170UJH1_TRIIF